MVTGIWRQSYVYLIHVHSLESELTLISSRTYPHKQWLPIWDGRPVEGYLAYIYVSHPFILSISFGILRRSDCQIIFLSLSLLANFTGVPEEVQLQEHWTWSSWLLLTQYVGLGPCCLFAMVLCGPVWSLSQHKVLSNDFMMARTSSDECIRWLHRKGLACQYEAIAFTDLWSVHDSSLCLHYSFV